MRVDLEPFNKELTKNVDLVDPFVGLNHYSQRLPLVAEERTQEKSRRAFEDNSVRTDFCMKVGRQFINLLDQPDVLPVV